MSCVYRYEAVNGGSSHNCISLLQMAMLPAAIDIVHVYRQALIVFRDLSGLAKTKAESIPSGRFHNRFCMNFLASYLRFFHQSLCPL